MVYLMAMSMLILASTYAFFFKYILSLEILVLVFQMTMIQSTGNYIVILMSILIMVLSAVIGLVLLIMQFRSISNDMVFNFIFY